MFINQNEMMKVAIGLHEMRLPFKAISKDDGLMIYCENPEWDVICTKNSQGYQDGLLEVYGLPQCEEADEDGIIGNLTGEEVLQLVEEAFL